MSIGCHRLNCDMLGISAFNFNIRLGVAQTNTLCLFVVGNKHYVFISLAKQTPLCLIYIPKGYIVFKCHKVRVKGSRCV